MERIHSEQWHLPPSLHPSSAASKHPIDTQLPLGWLSSVLIPSYHIDFMTVGSLGKELNSEGSTTAFLSYFPNPSFVLAPHCLQFEKMRWFHPNILLFSMTVSFALDCELLLHTGNNGTEAPCLFKRYHTVRVRELRIVFPKLICMCLVRVISQHSGK